MRTLIFDTETTGLPLWNDPSEDPRQPYVIQLGALLMDGRDEMASVKFLVNPGVEIPPDVTAIHGITTEMIRRTGVGMDTMLESFHDMFLHSDRVVGHNVSFDLRMMRIQFAKRGLKDSVSLGAKTALCTMKSLTNICKLPHAKGGGGYKWPKLEEAYAILINPDGFEGAHDAMADVKACARLLWWLEDNNLPIVTRAAA